MPAPSTLARGQPKSGLTRSVHDHLVAAYNRAALVASLVTIILNDCQDVGGDLKAELNAVLQSSERRQRSARGRLGYTPETRAHAAIHDRAEAGRRPLSWN